MNLSLLNNDMSSLRGQMLRGVSDPNNVFYDTRVFGLNAGLCFADGGDGGDGGGKPEKTFTQDDFEKTLAKRLSGKDKEIESLSKKLTTQEDAFEQMKAQLEALEAKASGNGAQANEKEVERLSKLVKRQEDQLKGMETEKNTATELAQRAVNQMTTFRVSSMVRDSLLANKAHADGLPDAVEAMMRSCNPEFDAERNELTLTVDGVPFTKPEEAAARFLERKPFYAQGIQGGAGGNRSNGSSGPNAEQMKDMSGQDLLLAGMKPPKG